MIWVILAIVGWFVFAVALVGLLWLWLSGEAKSSGSGR